MLDSTKKIVLIGKDAVPGSVKTRLQPKFSAEEAMDIYKSISLHVCRIALSTNLTVEVSFRGNIHGSFAKELKKLGCSLYQQEHDDLGCIIHRALHRADRVVAMGMDMPLVTTDEILHAMSQKELVFGPAEDGGYWLIAASTPTKKIFEHIHWSTDQVLAQSVMHCTKNKILYSLTKTHYDIDTAADLHRLLLDPLLPPLLHKRIQQYA